MVGPKRVVFADEISTGLDSSTTYQIIKWMRDTCHTQLDTMLIALLQPAPETWELFDDVLLIAEGAAAVRWLSAVAVICSLCLQLLCMAEMPDGDLQRACVLGQGCLSLALC